MVEFEVFTLIIGFPEFPNNKSIEADTLRLFIYRFYTPNSTAYKSNSTFFKSISSIHKSNSINDFEKIEFVLEKGWIRFVQIL